MSFDSILARSPSIIYRPGGVSGGLVVTSWTQVQKFIAARQGAVTVYVDDSLVSPALVPGVTGITEGFGRLVLDVYAGDSDAFSVLQIEDGATIQNLAKINVLEVRCNCQSATPSLAWTITPDGGYLQVAEVGKLSNAATATNPAVVLSGGRDLFLYLSNSFLSLHNPAVPIFSVAAGSALEFDAYDGSVVEPNFASGPGTVELVYDNATATFFTPPGVVPTLPLIGTYAPSNVDSVWETKLLDPVTMSAPAVGDVPQFNVDGTWHAVPVSSVNLTTFGAIIYKPGVASAGDTVATWPEVATFITNSHGKCIVYIDDSVVSPAPVPGVTGVTECFGRVVLQAYHIDSINFSVLEIEDGATLSNLYQVIDLELRLNCQSATKSLTWSGTPNGGFLILWQFGYLSMAAAATQPAISVVAGQTILIQADNNGTIAAEGFNEFTIPLANVAVGGEFQVEANNNSSVVSNFVQGAGNVLLEYDDSSGAFFFPDGVPPALPALTGTYTLFRNSTAPQLLSIPFAFNTASPLILVPVSAGGIMARAQIQITTLFDDPNATLLLGTSLSPSLVMGMADSDPHVVGAYDMSTMVTFPAIDKLQLTINPGASTQGAGTLYYELRVS